MPNMISHFGVQGLLTKTIFRDADLKWVYIGCIIPDVPWILQRIIKAISTGIDLYDLRLYFIIQASLFFCILLSLAMAILSTNILKIFTILSLNSLFHLILDACEVKWSGGVHFFVPLSWKMVRFDLFWPGGMITQIITISSVIFILLTWRSSLGIKNGISIRPLIRIWISASLIMMYFIFPFFLLQGPEDANNRFVKTLRSYVSREGNYIEFYRVRYIPTKSGGVLETGTGEKILVKGINLNERGEISIRGKFIKNNVVKVLDYYVHNHIIMDIANYIGITYFILLLLFFYLSRKKRQLHDKRLEHANQR